MRQLFVNHFGVLNSQKVRAQFVTLEGKQVLWLRVIPAESAAYVLSETKQKVFYIRNGNETRALEIEQIVAYHQTRFTPEAIKALPRPEPVPAVRSAKKKRFEDFRAVLDQIRKHPSERYFILKSIIINNLFGVDIMEEAVEICKLRLFLKLVAQVETVGQIEPLPDIDFNIRAGNTLVGYVSLEEIRQSQAGTLGFGASEVERIEEDALAVEKCFEQFRAQQTKHGGKVTGKDKQELRRRLAKLDHELDRYLAGEYHVDVEKEKAFDAWKASHQPFHWFVEFYGIMRNGGFDVIIGNPPYIVYSPAKVGYQILAHLYQTLDAKNLYVYCYERSILLGKQESQVGLIVQLTVLSSEKLDTFQNLLFKRGHFYAVSFPRRPESIFDGVEMPVAIILSFSGPPKGTVYSSRVSRFYTEERPNAIATLRLINHNVRRNSHRIAKIGTNLEQAIYSRLAPQKNSLASLSAKGSQHVLYYQEACRYWLKACVGMPYFKRNGERIDPPHGRIMTFNSKQAVAFGACVANSSLFYWFYSVFSDCEHVNDSLLREFPIPEDWQQTDWLECYSELAAQLEAHSKRKTIKTKQGHTIEYNEMKALHSKSIFDQIDASLAQHYGFSPEELDFIINYDIKYRMGQDGGDDGDDGDE